MATGQIIVFLTSALILIAALRFHFWRIAAISLLAGIAWIALPVEYLGRIAEAMMIAGIIYLWSLLRRTPNQNHPR